MLQADIRHVAVVDDARFGVGHADDDALYRVRIDGVLAQDVAESIERRLTRAAERKLNPEPALAIEQGRPTKRDRRKLADWDRWSASAEPD